MLENELYTKKIIKKYGDSFILRFSPDEVKILNLTRETAVVAHIQVLDRVLESQKPEKEVNTMQEQEFEDAHLEEGEEFDEDKEAEETEDELD